MKMIISEKIKGVAKILKEDKDLPTPGLSDQEQRLLQKNGEGLMQKVKDNINNKNETFAGMSLEDKIKLMAFVVYQRQNPDKNTIPSDSILNDEDASKILKSTLYRENTKKLDEDLTKQLVKGFGLKIKD